MPQDVFGLVGTTQGSFTVERVVAHGGFGVVYRAYHGAFRAPVALKCLRIPTMMPDDQRERFLEQFREEAEMLYRLSAAIPAVVRPLHHDVIALPSGLLVPFIALEWLEGRTLADFLESRARERQPALGPQEAAELLSPVARALEAAHHFPGDTGPICVIHRDLKPANIFLANLHGKQVVRILDFGIARARDAATVMAGQDTSASGVPAAFTPRYAAPEQWAPKRYGATGPWTDVWGLALTYLEIIAGRPIFDGTHMAIMTMALDEQRRPTPRNEGLAVPDALEALFCRALATDPRIRPKDAGAFWDELERALGLALDPRSAGDGKSLDPPGHTPPPRAPSFTSANAPTELAGEAGGGPVETSPSGLELDLPEPVPTPKPSRPQTARPPPARSSNPRAAATNLPISVDWTPEPRRPGRLAPMRPPQGPAPGPPGNTTQHHVELRAVFGLPLRLAGAGLLVSLVDQAAASLLFHGQRIGIGPFRLLWIAVALVLLGIIIALVRLFGSER